jgi:hypothetical protein
VRHVAGYCLKWLGASCNATALSGAVRHVTGYCFKCLGASCNRLYSLSGSVHHLTDYCLKWLGASWNRQYSFKWLGASCNATGLSGSVRRETGYWHVMSLSTLTFLILCFCLHFSFSASRPLWCKAHTKIKLSLCKDKWGRGSRTPVILKLVLVPGNLMASCFGCFTPGDIASSVYCAGGCVDPISGLDIAENRKVSSPVGNRSMVLPPSKTG